MTEVPATFQKQGIGTTLSVDALRLMNANNVETVKVFPTTDAGKATLRKLIRDGYLSEPIATSEAGATEHTILLRKPSKAPGVEAPLVKEGTVEAVPRAAPGMPEAGLQPSMIPEVAAKEVFPKGKGQITQISMDEAARLEEMRAAEAERLGVEQASKSLELAGLKEWLESEPAAKLINLIKKVGWYKGEIQNLTLKQYRDLTGKREIKPNLLTADKKHVRWEYALDEVAADMGYKTDEVLRDAVVQAKKAKDRIGEIERDLAEMPKPTEAQVTKVKEAAVGIVPESKIPPPVKPPERPTALMPEPEPKPEARAMSPQFYEYLKSKNLNIGLSEGDANAWLRLVGDAFTSKDLAVQRQSTIELRKAELAKRATRATEIFQEEYARTGDLEAAMKTARETALSGELPRVTSDMLKDITGDIRAVLLAKVHHHWSKVETEYSFFEENAAVEALTHALETGDIPRKRGTGTPWFPEGGSQYDRLVRVFGEEHPILKAIEQGKPIKDVVEGVFRETPTEPIPVDPEMAEYLRKLPTFGSQQVTGMVPPGEAKELLRFEPTGKLGLNKQAQQAGFGSFAEMAKDYESRYIDPRSPQELSYARAKLDLDYKLAKGEIDETHYKIDLAKAKEVAYPIPPVTRFEAPIEDAFKEMPLMTNMEKSTIVKVLKELAWSPVDIGNFLRANKASFDFSFWRQQKTLMFGNPKEFYDANVEAMKAMVSQKAAEANWVRITKDADYQWYEIAQAAGKDFLRPLELPKGTAQWKGTEEYGYLTGERVIPKLTEKLPWVRLSQRSFVTGTNWMNWEIFKKEIRAAERYRDRIASGEIKLPEGKAFDMKQEVIDIASRLADFSQRASLGKARGIAPALGALMFAPRATWAKIITPRHLFVSNPRVKVRAWRDLATFVAVNGGLVLAGEALGFWDVEKDPTSGEVMSIRIGNTRIDPWAGHRQLVTFYARAAALVMGKKGKSSVTGAEYQLSGESLIDNFVSGKLGPLAALFRDFITGRTYTGEKFEADNPRQWAERLSPFAIWDVYEAAKENWATGVGVIAPAIVGEGVQTYTGKWQDDEFNIGLPKYAENLPLGITEPVFDWGDFYSNYASQFKDVDLKTVTEVRGYSPKIIAVAKTKAIMDKADEIRSSPLIDLNANSAKGLTYRQLYQMWLKRQELVDAGDKAEWTVKELQSNGKYKDVTYKGEDAVEAYDKNEKTKPAKLYGQMSQSEYALLNQYHSITDKEAQKKFAAEHDILTKNPRQEHWKSNIEDNAYAALAGKADPINKEAYDKVWALAKQLDIPENAMSLNLPPREIADSYFKYQDMLTKFEAGSYEVKMLRLDDEKFEKWLEKDKPGQKGLQPVEVKSIDAARLIVKNRDKQAQFDTLRGRDAIATEKLRTDYLAKNQEFAYDRLKVDAFNAGLKGRLVDDYVGYNIKPLAGYEDDWYLLEHPEFYASMTSGDKPQWEQRDFTKVPTRRVAGVFEEYNAKNTDGTPKLTSVEKRNLRRNDSEFDDWLIKAKGYEPLRPPTAPVPTSRVARPRVAAAPRPAPAPRVAVPVARPASRPAQPAAPRIIVPQRRAPSRAGAAVLKRKGVLR